MDRYNPILSDEFINLLPALEQDEYDRLEVEILSEGCRTPVVEWYRDELKGLYLVDGFARYAICKQHQIPFDVEIRSFFDEQEAQRWVIRQHLARRNLTPWQRAELALKLKPAIVEQAKRNQSEGCQKSGNPPIRTDDVLAQEADTSRDTIHKVATVISCAPTHILTQARTGEISTNRAYRMTQAYNEAGPKTRRMVESHQIIEPETVTLFAELEHNGREVVDEALASGVITIAETDETVAITDTPAKLARTVERRSREHARQAYQSKFEQIILENSPVEWALIDGEGVMLYVNEEAYRKLDAVLGDLLVTLAVPAKEC
jgi:PAS domain-containing protein